MLAVLQRLNHHRQADARTGSQINNVDIGIAAHRERVPEGSLDVAALRSGLGGFLARGADCGNFDTLKRAPRRQMRKSTPGC